MICGFKWKAPYILGSETVWVVQQCIMPPGHEGNHRSLAKVTHKNDRPTRTN